MQNIQCIHRKKYTHNNKTLQNLKHNIIYKRWPHHILNCFCGIIYIYIYIYIYRPTEQQLCDDSAIQQYTENSKSSLNKLCCRRRQRLSVKQKYCAGIWLCNRSASPTPPPPPAAAAGAIMCRSVLSARCHRYIRRPAPAWLRRIRRDSATTLKRGLETKRVRPQRWISRFDFTTDRAAGFVVLDGVHDRARPAPRRGGPAH